MAKGVLGRETVAHRAFAPQMAAGAAGAAWGRRGRRGRWGRWGRWGRHSGSRSKAVAWLRRARQRALLGLGEVWSRPDRQGLYRYAASRC